MTENRPAEQFEDLPILRELRDRLEVEFRAPESSRAPIGRWRWLRRPSRRLLLLVGVLVVSGSAAAAVSLNGQRSAPLSGVVVDGGSGGIARSSYDIEIAPALQGGAIGWCSAITYHGDSRGFLGSGNCGGAGSTAAIGSPLFAPGLRSQGISYVLTAPQVAAVRVKDGPTVLTRRDPRLPFGFRAAVFKADHQSSPRSAGPPSSLAFELTALDARGRAIPGGTSPRFGEPTRFWQYPQRQATGSCSLHARRESRLHARWGRVVTGIVPDPGIIGRAFLSCIDTEYYLQGWPLDAAVLLDAEHPGTAPAALPGMARVAGHPGVFNRRLGLVGDISARRVGNAWLVVQGASGLQQRLTALGALTVGRINLRPPAPPQVQAGGRCTIRFRSRPGLRAVPENVPVPENVRRPGLPPKGTGHGPEFYVCARSDFYLDKWPLVATALLDAAHPGQPPTAPIPGLTPLPGHPGIVNAHEPGLGGDVTGRRIDDAWLLVGGGSGPQQRFKLLNDLVIRVTNHPHE